MAARGTGPGGLAARYAAALFELADETKQLDQTAADLSSLKQAIAASDDPQRSAVAESLRRSVGGKVAIDARVDPALIGGLVVKVGSRLIDSSLRTKLHRLQLAMKGIG